MNDQMNSGHAVSRYKRFRDETVEEFLRRRKFLLGYMLMTPIHKGTFCSLTFNCICDKTLFLIKNQ